MKNIETTLTQIIHSPERAAARERVTVKARLLFDYLKSPTLLSAGYDGWLAELTGSRTLRPFPGDPHVLLDEDGDVAVVQPYAEFFLLDSARSFGGTIGLILMAETCYEPTIGEPGLLNASLAGFQPLVGASGRTCTTLLHQFLEVDEDRNTWLAQQLNLLRIAASADSKLSWLDAAKIAVSTATIRGRKMRGCLVGPGVASIDLDQNDPALLKLLFTPPARGLASP